MRKVALAAALLISSAAIAQTTVDDQTDMTTDSVDMTTTEPTTSSATDRWANEPTTADPYSTTSTHTTISTTDSTGLASTTDTATTQTALASSQQVAPGNDDPEHDARGIAVISDPAFVPAGYNGVPATAVGGPNLEADNYPPCTASVTDNCRQTYERGID